MTLLLGTYGKLSTPFYLYTYQSKNYFCLQDINYIYCKQQLHSYLDSIQTIFQNHPHDFLKDSNTGHIFVMSRSVLLMARLFHCYYLAELCKLSMDEIMGRVGEPLFNLIHCDHWQLASQPEQVKVEPTPSFESLGSETWFKVSQRIEKFLTQPSKKEKERLSLDTLFKMHCPSSMPSLLEPYTTNPIYKWLSSNLYERDQSSNTVHMLLSATGTKRQQKLLIESRQRKAAFHNTKKKKEQEKSSKKLLKLHDPYFHHRKKQNIAGNFHSDPPALPLSPPQTTYPTKKRKSIYSPTLKPIYPPEPISLKKSKPNPRFHLETVIVTPAQDSQNTDNLNLLATQATQLRCLPLSPEVSPSPPPLFNHGNNYRLPSLKTMLSELHHNDHHFQFHNDRKNMNSCA